MAAAAIVLWGATCTLTHAGSSRSKHSERPRSAAARQNAAAGPLQIVVSLSRQRLTVFDRGVPIMTSAVSSGQAGHDTPAGIYTILQKNRYHESNIYSGAPMPYMQRITWSGIALHEGNLPGYPASHGCIRLPGGFASSLFALTKVGARVIVARDPLSPVPIEHDKLFRPEQPAQKPVTAQQPPPVTAGGAESPASGGGGFLVSPAAASALAPSATEPRSTAAASGDDRGPIPEAPVTATRADRDKAKSKTDSLVSVLISRKTGRIYIRQNFEPLHEAAIDIKDPDLPLGTHVFTATDFNDDKTRLVWNVVSYPTDGGHRIAQAVPRGRQSDADRADAAQGITRSWSTPAAAALERVDLGEEITDILSEVARPGMSVIISDSGPGHETGKGTEFVIQPGR